MSTYDQTRARLETYFDRTASQTWARLTSDAPVSRIRQTVREGRDRMRDSMLACLPDDLRGARVLDAGCGAGPMAVALAERGAEVLAVDISPSLLEVARKRTPAALLPRITFVAGDMLDAGFGAFDFVMAMDSLIHYSAADIGATLDGLARRTSQAIVFTIAPRTPMLSVMHLAGKAFPRGDRSPMIIPHTEAAIARALRAVAPATPRRLRRVTRISRGFYISQAMELRP